MATSVNASLGQESLFPLKLHQRALRPIEPGDEVATERASMGV